MKVNFTSNGSVNIDGRTFSGRSITISGNKVMVDGVEQDGELVGNINVAIVGGVQSFELGAGQVEIQGAVGSVNTMSGSVTCGNVSGDVGTMSGSVSCGHVAGKVSTMSGSIRTHKEGV